MRYRRLKIIACWLYAVMLFWVAQSDLSIFMLALMALWAYSMYLHEHEDSSLLAYEIEQYLEARERFN